MGIRVNFSETGDVTPREPVPSGKYRATVTDGELRDSNSSDYQYINWEFTIKEPAYDGRKVWSMTTLAPHALFSLKQLLEAVGMDANGELDFDIDDVIGKDLVLRIVKEGPGSYTDRRTGEKKEHDERNQVKSYIKDGATTNTGPSASSGKNALLP